MTGSEERLVVGKITSCYGIKGWVKIHSYTDPQENFRHFEQWQVRRRDQTETLVFDRIKPHGKGMVAHIKGVDDRTTAEAYAGLEVTVAADALPALEEGDYYWRELIGLQVWCFTADDPAAGAAAQPSVDRDRDRDGTGVLLGTVASLLETGANDVLVVKPGEGSVDDRERLIPWVPEQVVRRVDVAQGVIEVDWFLDEQ